MTENLACCILLAVAATLLAMQIQLSEWRLLTGRYYYKVSWPQSITYLATALVAALLAAYYWVEGFRLFSMVEAVVALVAWQMSEWLLARFSPQRLMVSVAWRLAVVAGLAVAMANRNAFDVLPFVAIGLCFRNSPLGTVHGKPLWLAYRMRRNATERPKPARGVEAGTRYNVVEHGILPNSGKDVLAEVQALIDEVGTKGGGTIFFPRGKYLFNAAGKKEFLKINHSHVTLEGETDEQGHLLAELVNDGPTTRGEKNPWLSPFFITTGEELQPSNIFWGLDFRRRKDVHQESNSLSDPGSDGRILTAPFATHVIADAAADSCLLKVEDSSKVGKYVLLGMYNTSPDGNLIKELLGVDSLRPEWKTARRAGDEEAPSFQWLVEVKRKIDSQTIELARPLLRDIRMEYEPALFNVEMLEDIHIRHLRLSSRWNGLFHHHGLPLYYSVAQAQEMDYGWNAINLKRTAHSTVENVEIRDFTNPLYVQDCRDILVSRVSVKGYDGHQGLKVYCHTCDCVFEQIDFYCHFADMMGGEGNVYANVFRDVRYLNPSFNPVDYDFHGFSEGPMAPPAWNVFERVEGFRYVKGAGAVFNQPACATGNVWRQCKGEGEERGVKLFYASTYRVKAGATKWVTAVGYTLVMLLKRKRFSPKLAKSLLTDKLKDIDRMSIRREEHGLFFPGCRVEEMDTTAVY